MVRRVHVMGTNMPGGMTKGMQIVLLMTQIVGLSTGTEQFKMIIVGQSFLKGFTKSFCGGFDGAKVLNGSNSLLEAL